MFVWIYDYGYNSMRYEGKVGQIFEKAYDRIAADLGKQATMCELGVNRGVSLQMWRDYFPDGRLIGVDRDENAVWPEGAEKVVCDQADPALPGLIGICDLIIDDCSHEAHITKRSWDLLWPCVRSGGYYVIEDWELGFAASPLFYAFGDANVKMAHDFLNLLDEPCRMDIESIQYLYGLIVFQKC